MSDYARTIAGIPPETYHQTLWFIRGYDRMKAEADDMIQEGHGQDGQPKSRDPGDPVAAAAIRRERITADIRIIETGLQAIEPEYRSVIMDYVARRRPLRTIPGAHYASASTWYRKRAAFVATVARLKNWA